MKPTPLPFAPLAPDAPPWVHKGRHFLIVLAFCVVISLVLQGFQPQQKYAPSLAYSLAIGLTIWVMIDFGRHLFPSAAETGWPAGGAGVALVLVSLVVGYAAGSVLADRISLAMGWYADSHFGSAYEVRKTLLISVIAGLIGSYYFYSRSKSSYLLRKMREAERHGNEARLKLLETQLEPHMLFNTLANVRALIAVDPPRAQQMLDHMIAYLRATLDASRSTTHTLQTEFDRLRDYLELMAIRMGPRLAYDLDLPAELATLPVPALLLQPLVENSIQHGLEPKVEGGRILVTARREGDRLLLVVSDTGVGASDGSRAGTGFGLTQVRERLASLHGNTASIVFEATPGEGARTRIGLPLAA